MKVLLSQPFPEGVIDYGIPETPEEMDQMFELRYKVYIEEKNFFNPTEELEKSGQEKDEYDLNGEALYYIGKVRGGKVFATSRAVTSTPTPTEKFFDVTLPEEIKNDAKERPLDIGRLISRPHFFNYTLPQRGTVLQLFQVMLTDLNKRGYTSGLGSIHKDVLEKLQKYNFPVHVLDNYVMKDVGAIETDFDLETFFNVETIPVYYISEEVYKFFAQQK